MAYHFDEYLSANLHRSVFLTIVFAWIPKHHKAAAVIFSLRHCLGRDIRCT